MKVKIVRNVIPAKKEDDAKVGKSTVPGVRETVPLQSSDEHSRLPLTPGYTVHGYLRVNKS